MKIAYTTYWKASEVKHWSGSVYYMAEALKNQGIILENIENLHSFSDDFFKIKSLYYRMILKKNYQRFREPRIIKKVAKKIEKRIEFSDADAIFSSGSLEISLLESKKPIIFWSDAVFAGILDYHLDYCNLNSKNIQMGNKLEQLALDNSELVIFASDWAANTAIENYSVDSSKIKVVPFGANLDYIPDMTLIKQKIESRNQKILKILFIGVQWYAKGGDILLKIIEIINRNGIKTEVNIVGTLPPANFKGLDNVNIHGFISKSTLEGRTKIEDLYYNSDIFILPTRAESYGIVFCEANAYGLPVIAPNIGGIPTIIKNGVNGYLASEDNLINNMADKAIELFENKKLYKEMALNAYNEYITRLNWDVSGKKVKQLLEEIL